MSRILFFVTKWILAISMFGFIIHKSEAQNEFGIDTLSDSSEISLLIASPGEENSWTIFGHAGIRVYDPINSIDITFNYGVFSFSDDFIFKFVKGETDYMATASYTSDYMNEYLGKGRDVTEFLLELRKTEKNYIWNYLLWNIKPENAVYRYNFLYNNCSTKPIDIILKATDGKFIFPKVNQSKSWRQIINEAEKNKPWIMFGSNLALGEPDDDIPSIKETLFLPLYVCKYLPSTRIKRKDGSMLAVVKDVRNYKSDVPPYKDESLFWDVVSPTNVFLLLLVLSVLFFKRSVRIKRNNKIFESCIFIISSFSGLILMFLSFFSEHPHTFPNYNMIIFNPLYLIVLPTIWISRLKKLHICFHIIIFATIILFFVMLPFMKQTFDFGVLIFAICILFQSLQSFFYVFRNIRRK